MTADISKAFREELSKATVDVINKLATILRNAEVHDQRNATWKPLIAGLIQSVQTLLRNERMAVLEVRDGQFSLNKNLIKAGFSDFGTFKFLAEELGRGACSGVEFKGVPSDIEVKKFAYAYAEATKDGTVPYEMVAQALSRAGVMRIGVLPAALDAGAAAVHRDPRIYAVYTFLKGVAAVHEIMEGLRSGKSVGFKRAKRFVQSAVDLMAVDRGLVLALTTIKNYDHYLYNHSVNVCLLSLMVGAKLGFDKARLGELGLAALLRDVGKASIPPEILDKKGGLTPEEWKKLHRFPFQAVTGLLRFRGFNEGALRQVIVAFEHSFQEPNPSLSFRDFNLFSRIAQLADSYDAQTTPRPYRPRPLMPDEALRNLIVDRHKMRTDPALIKTFIHAIGLYPVGTTVLLDTGEIAIVASPPFDMASLARPRVRLIAGRDGSEIAGNPMVDLMAFDETRGAYVRSIAKTLDRWKYGINVARHLLSDLPVQH